MYDELKWAQVFGAALRTAAVYDELKNMWRVCAALRVNPLVDPRRPEDGPVMSVMLRVLVDADRTQVRYLRVRGTHPNNCF